MRVAVMFAVWAAVTFVVLTSNVAALFPAATMHVVGTVAAGLSDVRLTTKPPTGARPVNVMVAVDEVPPVTAAEASLRLLTDGAKTVIAVVAVDAPKVAVSLTGVSEATADVLTVNVPDDLPPRIVTVAGTVADELLEVSGIDSVCPLGTGALNVTTIVRLFPPVTVGKWGWRPEITANWAENDAVALEIPLDAVTFPVAGPKLPLEMMGN